MSTDFGFIPEEGLFGILGAGKVVQKDKQHKTVYLGLNSDIAASNQATSVALRDALDGVETIPQGCKNISVEIKTVDGMSIDDGVEFCLGYFSAAASGDVEASLLSQRIVDESSKLTGDVVKAYKSISICDNLEGDKIALMNKVLQKSSAPALKKGSIAEPTDLVPNITLLKGSLDAGSLVFVFSYTL